MVGHRATREDRKITDKTAASCLMLGTLGKIGCRKTWNHMCADETFILMAVVLQISADTALLFIFAVLHWAKCLYHIPLSPHT